jgi:hypothetical protein
MHTHDVFGYNPTGWSIGNGLDSYSGGSRFKSRPGHRLCWLKFFVTKNCFQIIIRFSGAGKLSCTGAPFPVVKRQAREADHSPTISTEVKKVWIYTSTPLYEFMA